MIASECDVLLALCEAAPLIQDDDTAVQLFNQLSHYLLEAPAQKVVLSPYLRSIEISPWELLTYDLTRAILSIGIRHSVLHAAVTGCTVKYLRQCLRSINSSSSGRHVSEELANDVEITEILNTATISVSILGFLRAVSVYANFFSISERLESIRLLRQILDENLMVSVEGAFSSIRTCESNCRAVKEWKVYTKRYAASGRPLGAMLLQKEFMRYMVSCSSLQVTSAENLEKRDIFDVLTSDGKLDQQDIDDASVELKDLLSEISFESMRVLEDGSDYLQLGSVWQQQIAFAVKAHTLHTFLNCTVIDTDVADTDILMTWLEDTISNPVQMADEKLAYVVLRSMAVVASFSSSCASIFSRSLPKYVVQRGFKGETVTIAARSLTYILQTLSQDAVITGLYSFGNVLSARSGPDRALGGLELTDGNANSLKHIEIYTHQPTGSAISLDLSGEEETAAAYGNVVRIIVRIASIYRDDKITALVQSMLLQKLGRVSTAVDLCIITETAKLATAGGLTEFKSLLKMYARFGHEAAVNGNVKLAESVRSEWSVRQYQLLKRYR